MVGDNPNAAVDPEVISPLSKLRQLIGEGTQQIYITGELVGRGTNIIASLDQAVAIRKGVRGF